MAAVLECVVNISEGRRLPIVTLIALEAGDALLDVHSDWHHNRSVITLGGHDVDVLAAAFSVTVAAISEIDLREHRGVHPRLGAVDVVPFVPLPATGATMTDAVAARDAFASRVARELGVPCFLYGPERTLPEIRRDAFTSLAPDVGPADAHPSAGAICVGSRDVLVAYNIQLDHADMAEARRIAASLRGPAVRALAFETRRAQVSCNLVDPARVGPADVYDRVAAHAAVAGAELVGLVPTAVLEAIPPARWAELGLSADQTIEARLRQAGLDGGSLM
jgi:glutamate formiminotransferase